MIHLTRQSQLLLATQPADFRKQIDGLVAVCEQRLKKDPRSGCVFVFINRSKTMVRALVYEGHGYWLITKRLSKGTFKHWPTAEDEACTFDAGNLLVLLRGKDWKKMK